jgi:hypothetical protein
MPASISPFSCGGSLSGLLGTGVRKPVLRGFHWLQVLGSRCRSLAPLWNRPRGPAACSCGDSCFGRSQDFRPVGTARPCRWSLAGLFIMSPAAQVRATQTSANLAPDKEATLEIWAAQARQPSRPDRQGGVRHGTRLPQAPSIVQLETAVPGPLQTQTAATKVTSRHHGCNPVEIFKVCTCGHSMPFK